MDLKISQMMDMQKRLFSLHQLEWPPMEPSQGKTMMLYMVEEMGEAIAVLKKKGDDAVMGDPDVRAAFVEEMADALMYYMETLLRYQVTPEEISESYVRKHSRNMGRDYKQEYEELYHNG